MLNIVLVGCGFMGRMHANVIAMLPNARLVAVVDKDPGRAQEFAGRYGVPGFATLETALGNVEAQAVDICLPTYLHREFTERAAAHRKHVMCEKPMARTIGDADAMIRACANAGVRLMIGHCIRFWPEYAHVKRLMDEGALGRLLSINLTRYGQFPGWSADNWLADEAKAGGGALDMHIHDTDYALYLFGEPSSYASYGTDDGRGIGQIFTTMGFRNGGIAHLEGGWNLPEGTPFKMAFRAIFERGAAIFDGGPLTVYRTGHAPETVEFERTAVEGGGNISDLGGYLPELQYFVDRVLSGEAFEINPAESSRDSLEWCLREIEAVRTRSMVMT
ncbi:MAG: Gfo/Idh/MocA family protein [Fimbriimonas sp.]